ncbi:Protein phosphatase 1 regulatory subunit 37 [Taenia solium]|eukprot:TsM_000943300 transcript=TsM_000943300 gene=TsM_000943300
MQSDQAKIHNENIQDDATAAAAPQHKVPPNNRHVRFPEDDSIILGCLEPFRPTPDNCTSDELIAAYIASCKLYKTPTVDFLLEQLRGIDLSICNERYSRLCLRGIKLSRFQIETLEEVFRRVHFQEVDLEDTFLDEASATALFDMMLHYETCVDLSISLNLEKFGPSIAWPRCITYLRKSAALQGFKLSHTPLVTNHFSGLSLSGLSLKSLTFRDCALTGPPLHYLLRLLRYLMTYTGNSNDSGPSKASAGANGSRYPRPSYRGPMAPMPWGLSLHLPENRIHGADAESLLLLVRHQLVLLPGPPTPPTPDTSAVTTASSCTNKPTGGSGYLEELDLSHNSLRDEGVQVLCSGLLQAYELQHRRLEVALAAIAQATSASGTSSSAPAIMPPKCALPQARGLQRLNLADNGLGNGKAGRHLAAVLCCSIERLAPLLGGLTHLDLSDNPAFGDVGVVDLCDGLVRNFTLRELYLRNVRLGFDGVFALSGYIGETKCLVHLDIRQNTIDIAGMMALTRTLKVNESLTALLLDARRSTLPSNEKQGMIRTLLQELEGYLRRNRSSQAAAPSATLPKELETFSPKLQTTIERMSSTHVIEDVNNPEEAEIKEILLDPPKRTVTHTNDISSSWSPKKMKEGPAEQLVVEDEMVLISDMESNGDESLSELKPKQELMQLHPTYLGSPSADISVVEEVRAHITTEASQSETGSLVRGLPMVPGHLKLEDTSEQESSMNPPVVSQPESEDLAGESSIDSEAPKLDHQAIAVLQSNDTLSAILPNAEEHVSSSSAAGEPEFEGLGSEPPMEFETFLMVQEEANQTLNVGPNEVEETPVNLSIHGQFIDNLGKEPAMETKNIYLDSSDLGVEAEAFQSDHSKATVCHSNDGANKGSNDPEGSLIDPPITDGARMEHIFEPCKPTTKQSESGNVVDSDVLRAERNDTMKFQADGTPILGSSVADDAIDDGRATKMDALQVVPNSNEELNKTSTESNGCSADLYNTEEATLPTALDARKPEIEVPQDETAVDQTCGALNLSSIDVEESSVDLPITEEAKIPISMDNIQSDIGEFPDAPLIDSKKLDMDNSKPVVPQLKDMPHQDFLNDVDVGKLETGQVVKLSSEIKAYPSMARKLEESPAGPPAVEVAKIFTTSNTCDPKVEASWSPQAVEAVDFSTTDVKESPMTSSVIEELKASVNVGAGQFDVEDVGNESTIKFEAFQSVHSKSADHGTNDAMAKGPAEAELRISPRLGIQPEEVDRGNLVKADNLLKNSPTSAVVSTSQKSSSEDLLKEAMQQYLNPELIAEVRQENTTTTIQPPFTEDTPVASATERSANLDPETSESDDSLFNETSGSLKTTENPLIGEVKEETFFEWAENQGVLGDDKKKEPKEGRFKKASFCGEEVYWGDAEWDSNIAEERNVSSKTEDLSQPDSTKCMEISDENAFEVAGKPVLDAKVSQSDLELIESGFEASVKIEEGSFHLHDHITKIEIVNVPTTEDWKGNTGDEIGQVKGSVEGQSGLHGMEDVSNGASHPPSSTLKDGDEKLDGESRQLTSEERVSTTLDNTNAEDIGISEKIFEQLEEAHIGKSVCMEKCDTFAEHSDDVLLHNADWGVFSESNRCTTTDGASELVGSGEENMEDVSYLDLKDIPKSSDKPSTLAPTEPSKSPDFVATSTKPILPDNEVTEPVEFTDFVAPDVHCNSTESKPLIEPENSAIDQKETDNEQTGYQNDVLSGKTGFEKPQSPLHGDRNSESEEGLRSPFKVNFGSSQLSPATSYEGKEVPNSVLKQLSPTGEGAMHSTVIVRDLGNEDGASKLSGVAEDMGMRPMGRSDDFLDPALIETEPHSGEFDQNRTTHISLDRSPDTRPLEESGVDTIPNVGRENGSDNSSRGEGTESERLSGPLKTNLHATSASHFASITPDSVHESEGVALSGGEAEPVLLESLGGMLSKLSEADVSFKSSIVFDSKEKSANQLSDSTSLEKSKLDAEDASWADFEGAKSVHQIDEEAGHSDTSSSLHEEPSATTWMVVELSETEKNSTTSTLGERTATHESPELTYAGDFRLGSGDEISGGIRVSSPNDKHFDSSQSGDEVVRGDGSDSKLSVNEEGKIKSSDANQMDPSNGGSIGDANWANFSAETGQTSGISDTKSLNFKLITEDLPPLSVLTGPLEPAGTLGKFDELLEKPLEDVRSFKDLTSGEFALKKDAVESTMEMSIGAKERTEDTLIDTDWNYLDQPELDTKPSGVFAVQEGQFNKAEPTSQSVEPEISSLAAEHGTEDKSEEEFHFREPIDPDNLRFRTPWGDVDQLGDLEGAFTEATGLEINTKSDEPTIGCKVDSNGSDDLGVDDWGADSGRLQESSDQFHHTDLLDDFGHYVDPQSSCMLTAGIPHHTNAVLQYNT